MTPRGRALAAIALLVFVPALAIRLHPTVRESFQYDAITSQMAAQRGVAANAWDDDGTFELRRRHPPFLSYVILANNALFGSGELGACAFSIVSGALTCVLVALGTLDAAAGLRGAKLAALFAGWLLAFLPVHLFVSRSSNWDAVYALFATAALLLLTRYVASERPGRRALVAGAALAALALVTSELGLFLLPVFVFALVVDLQREPRMPRREIAARYAIAFAVALAIFIVLWPAGLFELSLAKTIWSRTHDSLLKESNHPWYMFYVELFRQSAAFTIIAALGFVWFVLGSARNMRLRLAPLWIYVAIGIVLSARQSWVHVHLKDDLFPPLAILGATALASLAERREGATARSARPALRSLAAVTAGAVILISTIASAIGTDDTMVVGPEEHPGYRGVAAFLANHPGARTYSYYATIMPYFLRGAHMEGDAERPWTPERIESVKERRYDFVVTDFTFFNERYPDIERLGAAFAPEYELAHTVMHRRTREPVAWIFARSPAPSGNAPAAPNETQRAP